MVSGDLYDSFLDIVGRDKVFRDYDMSLRSSFKTGGRADILVCPGDRGQVIESVKLARSSGQQIYIIGKSTNLLIRDGGLPGITICLYDNFNHISVDGNIIHAQAGALLSAVANYACRSSLTGMEFAAGIPGSVGGAVKMNAGAYGYDVGNFIKSAEVFLVSGEIVVMDREMLQFSYRKSAVAEGDVVLRAEFELNKGKMKEIRSAMIDYGKLRKSKQPLNMPSAGSIFKRPEGDYAGRLIELAGLKGCRIGGAMVSEKHAGFIVNDGHATSRDVEELINHVKAKVFEDSGIALETEVKIIGVY